jgi:hypothetical protein
MKNKFTLIFIFIVSISVFPQYFRAGLSANFLMKNKNLSYQVGPSLIADYTFEKVPFTISANLRFYLAEFNDESKSFSGRSMGMTSIGASISYYPIRWAIEPYIGTGFFYNAHQIDEGPYINNFSMEVTGGLKFSANSRINFISEISQSFDKPQNFDFNSLFLKLGLLFRI